MLKVPPSINPFAISIELEKDQLPMLPCFFILPLWFNIPLINVVSLMYKSVCGSLISNASPKSLVIGISLLTSPVSTRIMELLLPLKPVNSSVELNSFTRLYPIAKTQLPLTVGIG